jgi:hypothetical protein
MEKEKQNGQWSEPKKTRFRRTIEIKRIKETLRDAEFHKRITYSELSKVAGRPVRAGNPGYGSLRQAVKELREEGIHFSTISDDWCEGKQVEGGLERITDEEAIKLVPVDTKIINSRAKLLMSKVRNVAYDTLSDDLKALHNTLMTVGQAVEVTTNNETLVIIEGKVRVGNCPIPTRELVLMV